MSETTGGAFPGLRYRDANAAIDWLKHAVGATERTVHRGDDGSVMHAVIEVGTGIVLLGDFAGDSFLGSDGFEPRRSSIGIYVVVDDPDAKYESAKTAGADVVRELEDMDYGSREFSVRDPEGNLWSFGTYDPRAPDGP
ncbi:VOC family protein [soil metagenome]